MGFWQFKQILNFSYREKIPHNKHFCTEGMFFFLINYFVLMFIDSDVSNQSNDNYPTICFHTKLSKFIEEHGYKSNNRPKMVYVFFMYLLFSTVPLK